MVNVMKKTIKDYNLEGKKVIIRVDFNVPIKDGEIQDDNRIKQSLETINYALKHNAKIILLSHLGRVKEESDKESNTLEPVALRLSELLDKEIIFVTEKEIFKYEIFSIYATGSYRRPATPAPWRAPSSAGEPI